MPVVERLPRTTPVVEYNIEGEVADLLREHPPRGTPQQVGRVEPLPGYVQHLDGVTKVGELTAEAVVRDYEAAAKEIEAMGAELMEAARKCEAMTADVRKAIALTRETAETYREEAKRIFLRIEQCAVMTDDVRKMCTTAREKIANTGTS
jgi:hypothetical protein